MKKFFLMIVMAATAMTMSAQEGFWGNKFFDNWYIGVNGGVATKTTNQNLLKNLNGNAGVRVGKWITPSVGIALESNALLSNKADGVKVSNTVVNVLNTNLLGQLNLTNMICGYPGTPRPFELVANAGLGWGHNFGTVNETLGLGTTLNTLNQKLALDFNFNFGSKKEWQFFVEPSITYCIAGAKGGDRYYGEQLVNYDVNYSFLQLNVGFNYKFITSNKTHNFALITACDQNEIDALNATINNLRGQNAADADEIARLKNEIDALKKALKECEEKPAPVVEAEPVIEPNLPAVFYQLNKSIITPEQAKNVAIAAAVMKNHPDLKIKIKGYASPEGPHDNNNSLSVRRAAAVKDMLVKKYGIDGDRISTEGCGETDKLFEIFELNRVAMLYIVK